MNWQDWLRLLLWLSVSGIGWTYVGFPLLLAGWSALHQLRSDWRLVSTGANRRAAEGRSTLPDVDATTGESSWPHVAVLVAAHNEEHHIVARVLNLLAQDYPSERLRIYIGSDASTDRTVELLRTLDDPRLKWIDFAHRRGKPAVIDDLVHLSSEPLLVFTDANTVFAPDAIRRLVRHFDRPDVGCVCGELVLRRPGQGDNPDHLYWRFERLLKFLESRIGTLLGANGGIYALRRSCYRPVPSDAIVDDFWISMAVLEAGHRCIYDPEARAIEDTPAHIADEVARRTRIGAGNYQALVRFRGLLHPRRGSLAFVFFSHKCLRWFVPHLMLLALFANAAIAADGDVAYGVLLGGQLGFYGLAAVAGWKARRGLAPRWGRLPMFVVGINLGLLRGSWHFLRGMRGGAWERTERTGEELRRE